MLQNMLNIDFNGNIVFMSRWLQLGQVGEGAELGHVRPALIRLRTGQRRPERHVVKGEYEDNKIINSKLAT